MSKRMKDARGAVVKGPDLFGDSEFRPYVLVSDSSHPFRDEEAMYVAVTTTRRSVAVPLGKDDFVSGGLPKESYVNPWTIATIRHADMGDREGQLTEEAIDTIATETAGYLGIRR